MDRNQACRARLASAAMLLNLDRGQVIRVAANPSAINRLNHLFQDDKIPKSHAKPNRQYVTVRIDRV